MDVRNGRYIVNGAHESVKLQNLLDGFIKKFVLCPECENPETDLVCMCVCVCIRVKYITCGIDLETGCLY